MADIDTLPAAGVPFRAQVDANGIALGGSKTVLRLAQSGMRPFCAVDSNGLNGAVTIDQLAARGIRALCLVDENGLASGVTADVLRGRGIRPLVPLTSAGLSGSTTKAQLAARGLESACVVDETGTAAGGPPPSPLDGLTPTAGWSAGRKLLTAYGGPFYNASGGLVDTFYDQTANVLNLGAGSTFRPTITTLGGIPALLHDGNNNRLTGPSAGSFITTTSGYMIMSMRTSAAGGTLMSDSSDNSDMNINAGPTYSASLWDGGGKGTAGIAIALNTTFVLEWRLQSGVLYARVNGGTETSVAVGTITSLGTFRLCWWTFAGYILEAATFKVVPSLAQRNALVANFGAYAGAF